MKDHLEDVRRLHELSAKLLARKNLSDHELTLQFVSFAPHQVHKAPTYYFRMVHTDSAEELGNINLRVSAIAHVELYAGHVGYGVHPAFRGHRYASRSLRLLIPIARELKLDPLWITCDPENFASRRTCEIAGAKFIEIVEVPKTCIIHRSGHPEKCRYRLNLS